MEANRAAHPAPSGWTEATAGDGAWRTLFRALAAAPANARLTVGGIWLLAALVLIVQFWIDFDGFLPLTAVNHGLSLGLPRTGDGHAWRLYEFEAHAFNDGR